MSVRVRCMHLVLVLALFSWHAEAAQPPSPPRPPPPPVPPPPSWGSTGTVAGTVDTVAAGFASTTMHMALNTLTGDVYVSARHRIVAVSLAGSSSSTFVGSSSLSGTDDSFGGFARFNNIRGLAFRASEDVLYVADSSNCRIRKVYRSIGADWATTVTGSTCGNVNGGTGSAKLHTPWGLALHPNNNDLYFSEPGNACIRKLSLSTLVVSAAVGQCGTPGYADGTATQARFGAGGPLGIAFRGADLWIADSGNYVVRVFLANGNVQTVAGTQGVPGLAYGPALTASFLSPTDITFDTTGSDPGLTKAMITDGNQVRKLSLRSPMQVDLVAGSPVGTPGFVDGAASDTRFDTLVGLLFYPGPTRSTLLVADSGNQVVRRVRSPADRMVTTIEDGTGPTVALGKPTHLAFNYGAGVLYVSSDDNVILAVDQATGVVTKLAGIGTPGNDNGPAVTTAKFRDPRGIVYRASEGAVYVADNGSKMIRRIASGTVSTVASGLDDPIGLALHPTDDNLLYFADKYCIRKLTLSTLVVSNVAGYCGFSMSYSDGSAIGAATFNRPSGITFSKTGELWIADTGNEVVRVLSASGTTVTTVAGTPGQHGYIDGVALAAKFEDPYGIEFHPVDGTAYISDMTDNRIRALDPRLDPPEVYTLAGTGSRGSVDGLLLSAAKFDSPRGMAFVGANMLVIADYGNQRIRGCDLSEQLPTTDMKSVMMLYRMPPVIRLFGNPSITLHLYSGVWSDPGAYAIDGAVGPVRVVVVSVPAANFTNATTDPHAPLVVTYIAVSALGGLTSVATRSLHVVDACSAALGSREFTCVKDRKCSVNGLCGVVPAAVSNLFASIGGGSGEVVLWWHGDAIKGEDVVTLEMPTAVSEWIPPDTTPPTLTLLAGNYPTTAFVTAKGRLGVLTTVEVGEAYADPGAIASKVPVNNPSQVMDLNSEIFVTGLDEVSTQAPTADGAPFVVTYKVQDFAVPPNTAVMRRRVEVVCPPGEIVCTGDDGALTCSDGDICGVRGSEDAGSAVMPGSAAAAMAATRSSGDAATDLGAVANILGNGGFNSVDHHYGHAILAVLGANPARVRVGTPYSACNGGMGTTCDAGVMATLHTPNDMRTCVIACADKARAVGISEPMPYAAVGLMYCGINVNVPGVYKVKYTVQAGRGPLAIGIRTVIVEAECPAGEAMCTTGTCSSDGMCAGDLSNALTPAIARGGSAWVDGSEQPALALALALALAPTFNTPPRLALRTASGFGPEVSIKQGTVYAMCAPGQVPSEDVPCDLGVVAEDDEDGPTVNTSVLLCPPTACWAASSCNGHRVFEKDASKCGLDTSAEVGTTYLLTFVVYDKEGLNATVSRAVTILSRCPMDRPYLCSGTCEAIDCTMLAQLESAIVAVGDGDTATDTLQGSPVIMLLPAASANLTTAALLAEPPSSQTVFVVYGAPAPVSLLPCTSVGAVGSCAAAAVQLLADGFLIDLSSSISVTDVTPLDDGTDDGASAATALGRCSAAALSLGTCLPGVYALQYSVPGASQPAHLSVVVEQLAVTEFNYTFAPPDGSSLSAAANFVTQLSSNATLLLATVMEHMPSFGISASTVRGAVLNNNAVVARDTGAGTVYDISVVLTVTTGSSTPLPLPGGSGRRRLRSASLDLGAPDATAVGAMGSKQHHVSHIAAEHNISPPSSGNTKTSGGGDANARLRVASACVGGVVSSLLRVRLLIDDLSAMLVCGSSTCTSPDCDCDDGDSYYDDSGSCSSPDGIHEAAAPTRRLMDMQSRRRQLLQSGCNAPGAAAVAAPGGSVVSGGATMSACASAVPTTDAMYLSLILGAASDVAAATSAIQASTASMAVTISLVDTFDLYDTAAQAAYTEMYNDVSWASGNVSTQLDFADDLLSRTLVAQAAFNNELSATGALMASTLTLLQQQLTRTVINAQLVLEGLGILDDSTLADFQQCVFNASVGRRFAFKVGTTTAASRRSLLPTASGTPSGDPYVFQGYGVFPDAASYQYNLYDTWNIDLARFVGSGYSNRVLSGLLLHTVRRSVASVTEEVCKNASSDEMELRMRVCQSTAYPALVTACRNEAVSTTVAYVDGGGVGSDPVFNQLSSLYNKQVSMSDFYNMSDGSPEVNNVTGIPFGFFHTPLKGFDDGYPLLFDTHVSEKRIVDLLHYVQDGGMLSTQLTRSMTLQMVTYNPEAVVFGYFSATFTWIDSGVISMTSKLMALPAVEYHHVISSGQFQTLLPDMFLVILVVAYIALTSWDIVASLRSQRKLSKMSKVSPVNTIAALNPLWDGGRGAERLSDHVPYTPAMLADTERAAETHAVHAPRPPTGFLLVQTLPGPPQYGNGCDRPPSAGASSTFNSAPLPVAATNDSGLDAPSSVPTTPTKRGGGIGRGRSFTHGGATTLAHDSRPCSPLSAATRPGPVAEGTDSADDCIGAKPPTSSTSLWGTPTRGHGHSGDFGGGTRGRFSSLGGEPLMVLSPAEFVVSAPGGTPAGLLTPRKQHSPGPSIYHHASSPPPALSHRVSTIETDRVLEAEIAEAALEAEDAVRKDRGLGAPALRRAQKYTASMSPFWIAFEAAMCALMVACVVLWFVYSAQLVSSNIFATRFDAYDADAFATARMLLPRRDESAAAAAQFLAETGRDVPPAGTAGRWRLPADTSGLEGVARLVSRVDTMYTIYVLYYFLQGFVLLGLIVRLIMYLSFQRRLSIIGGTLAALVPELFHFVLVVTVLFCMMAIFLNTIFGYRVIATATFGEAIFTLFKMLVFGDDAELYNACTVPGLDAPLERSMASAFRGVVSVLIVWVLRMYLASFIILIYAGLNQYAKHMPAVLQDLRRMFKWWAQKVQCKAPSNVHIEKMLDKVLEEGGGPSGLLARVRATVARSVLRDAAGPAVRADLGALSSTRLGSMDGSKSGGGLRGGGIRLDGFSPLMSSKDLGAALLLASGRLTLNGSLPVSINAPHISGWVSDQLHCVADGQRPHSSKAGSPVGALQCMSSRLSITQISITADGPSLPRGNGISLADLLIKRQHAAVVAMPGGGGSIGGGGGIFAEEAPDLATMRDALMARFGTSRWMAPESGAAGLTSGAAPVMSGARSRKTTAATIGQHRALRQRITAMAKTSAGTAAVDDDDGVDRAEAARLRHALFRAVVIELAHAQGQLTAMRAAQADLERMVAALACALPPPGTVSGMLMLPRLSSPSSLPPRADDRQAGEERPLAPLAPPRPACLDALAMASAPFVGAAAKQQSSQPEAEWDTQTAAGQSSGHMTLSEVEHIVMRPFMPDSVPPSGALSQTSAAPIAPLPPRLQRISSEQWDDELLHSAAGSLVGHRTLSGELHELMQMGHTAAAPAHASARARPSSDGTARSLKGPTLSIALRQLSSALQDLDHTAAVPKVAARARLFSDGSESVDEGSTATSLPAAHNQFDERMRGEQREEQ
ncbi:hypothetical protein FOA52_014236 [Chlamydomonas sp. UWO 241]|nr:hypothetical protein FOA52_014236 [Chlamydomonas sp. UWO 241]